MIYCNVNSFTKNKTFWTVCLNANNKCFWACFNRSLNMEINRYAGVIIEY